MAPEHVGTGMCIRFELRNCGERFFFVLRSAADGSLVLTSELHPTKAAALDAIEAARESAVTERYYQRRVSASSGRPFFVLCAATGAVLATSGAYASAFLRNRAIAELKANTRRAVVKDETHPRARRLAPTAIAPTAIAPTAIAPAAIAGASRETLGGEPERRRAG